MSVFSSIATGKFTFIYTALTGSDPIKEFKLANVAWNGQVIKLANAGWIVKSEEWSHYPVEKGIEYHLDGAVNNIRSNYQPVNIDTESLKLIVTSFQGEKKWN